MEIERKFLSPRLPEHLEEYPSKRLEQAYLCTDPALRVRRAGEEYILTCKGRGLMVRQELEMPLSRESYEHLLSKADGTVIRKERFFLPLGRYTVELDRFEAPFAPLVMAEVEFPSVEEAESFLPPDWFGREVTEDPAYQNSSLSKRGTEA